MDIESRLGALHSSLGEFGASDPVPWELGAIFNSLLEEVKKGHGEDSVVAVIEPVRQASSGKFAQTNCGGLRGATLQLLNAVG